MFVEFSLVQTVQNIAWLTGVILSGYGIAELLISGLESYIKSR